MKESIRPIEQQDREAVIDLFNHYVEHSFAAYPETKVPYQAFDQFLQGPAGYPKLAVVAEDGGLAGFGLLRAHHPLPAFSRAAEATYFLRPDCTGRGLGSRLLRRLEEGALACGVTTILASISSLNPASLHFHAQQGFAECGRFAGIGRKWGRDFDVVWMQKRL